MVSSTRATVYDDLEGMYKEVVITYFNSVFRVLHYCNSMCRLLHFYANVTPVFEIGCHHWSRWTSHPHFLGNKWEEKE